MSIHTQHYSAYKSNSSGGILGGIGKHNKTSQEFTTNSKGHTARFPMHVSIAALHNIVAACMAEDRPIFSVAYPSWNSWLVCSVLLACLMHRVASHIFLPFAQVRLRTVWDLKVNGKGCSHVIKWKKSREMFLLSLSHDALTFLLFFPISTHHLNVFLQSCPVLLNKWR